MGYRTTSEFQAPFRLFPYIDEISNYKIVLDLRIKACFPKNIVASYITAKISMPKSTSTVTPELSKVFLTLFKVFNNLKGDNQSNS